MYRCAMIVAAGSSSTVLLSVVVVLVLAGGTYLLLGSGERQKKGSVRGRRAPTKFRSRRSGRWQKRIAVLLLLGAIACVAAAVAQFRVNRQVRQGTVILVIDASESMNNKDIAPSRLEAAESAAREFLQQLPADFRVGLVSFARAPALVLSPTADRNQAEAATSTLTTSSGTSIGDGLTSALDALQDDWRRNGNGPAAVVLLTDGLDTRSRVPPLQAANRATSLGVPVFTVAVGATEPGSQRGANTELLRQIADATGAKSFTAQSASQLTQVYGTLGSRLSYDLAVTNIGAYFVVAAVVLAVAAGVLTLLASRPQD
jgi:Ca-activated chloride channel family protein